MNVQNISRAVGSGAAVPETNPFVDEAYWQACLADDRAAALRTVDEVQLDGLGLAVRDQARRGTCIAFAASACAELAQHAHDGTVQQLSPEFLYWHLRQDPDGAANVPLWEKGATKLAQAANILPDHGLCTEDLAPYNPYQRHKRYAACDPDPMPLEPTTYEPSAAATTDAAGRKFEAVLSEDFLGNKPGIALAARVHDELLAGRAVAVAVPVFRFRCTNFDNWTNWTTISTGVVPSPVEAPELVDRSQIKSAHSVCVTGFQQDPTGQTDGWFIFRNSWNSRFAKHVVNPGDWSPKLPGHGYGALSVRYLDTFAFEVLSLKAI